MKSFCSKHLWKKLLKLTFRTKVSLSLSTIQNSRSLCSIFLAMALMLTSMLSSGQSNVASRILINGSTDLKGAFLFFPLTSDSISLENPNLFVLLKQNVTKRIFYCVHNDEKSKIYDLSLEILHDSVINFRIPDTLFYQCLYKTKACPLCHKSDYVVPYIYGKPGSRAINMARKGEIKLAGCFLSNTSPRFYCKTDKLEF